MTGPFAEIMNVSNVLVASVVAIAMVAGAVDMIRQPGWAWKTAGEPKVICLLLVLLLPGVGLAIYVFGARPKIVAIVASGRAANLPFERFGNHGPPAAQRNRSIQALTAATSLGSFGEARTTRPVHASGSQGEPAPASATGFFEDPDLVTVQPAGRAVDAGDPQGSPAPSGVPAVVDAPEPVEIRIPGGLGRPYNPRQRTSLDGSGPTLQAPPARSAGPMAPVPGRPPMSTPGAPEIFRPRPMSVAPLAAAPAGGGATMTLTAPPKASMAARWLPDPTSRHQYRYWDGGNWTENVYDAGVESRDPVTG
jgi:hypothetical protein